MQQRYSRSLFLLIILNLLIKPFWLLGIERSVNIAVGVTEYGRYTPLFSLAFIVSILLDPGLHTFTNTSLAQNKSTLAKYFSAFVPLKLMLSLLYLAVTMLCGVLLNYSPANLYLLFWIALAQVLSSFLLYIRANFSGLHLFNTDSIFSILDRVLMIFILAFLLWGGFAGNFKIEWFVYAQLAAFSLSIMAAFPVLLQQAKKIRFRIKLSILFIVLRKSYPYALLTILMMLYTRIDALMIERLLPGNQGKYQAGLYASAFRLLEALTMIAYLVATILLPVFAGMIRRRESINEVVGTYTRLLLVPAFLVVAACFAYRNEIMYLLYPDFATEYLGWLFGSIMISFLAFCSSYIFGTLLTANASLRFLNKISAAGVIANILLNFILIRYFSALGAVIATLITQFFVSVLQIINSKRIFQLSIGVKDTAAALFYIIFVILSFAAGRFLPVPWMAQLIILCIINLIFAFVTGLLKIKFFLNILKLKE
jgi:O-antigen/teichoic acid export membrane protein